MAVDRQESYFSHVLQAKGLIQERPQDWHLYASNNCQVLNNMCWRATGFTPNHLHIGLKPNQTYHDLINILSGSPPLSGSKIIDDRVREVEITHTFSLL